MEEYLNKIYFDPLHPASFGGIGPIRETVKADNKKLITTRDIKNWLSTKDTYTLHKPLRRNFKRNRVIVSGIDSQWQADLVDVSSLSRQNKGHRYILTCIDIFSKYAWARVLKNKTGKSIVNAFQSIFKERQPKSLQTDKGTEFKNQLFQQFLRKNNIHFFTTNNETKASVVERFNRTLKSRMWRYFTANGNRRYIDVLQKFLVSYNKSLHRSIGKAPEDVNVTNQEEVWQALYGRDFSPDQSEQKFKLELNDPVRISMATRPFRKGYLPQWTDEVFTVSERHSRNPPVYTLKDYGGETIEGTFYDYELQKVSKTDHTYRIEKILKRRKRNGRKEYFVKWKGYPSKFNSWVNDSFYVTLPSNSSPDVYPQNTLTNYRVKLAQPITLEGDWEVGLAEFIYPHQWYNIDEECKYSYTIDGGDRWLIKVIEPGLYDSIDSILHALKTDYNSLIQYHYNQYTRKLRINLLKGAQVKFRGRLAEILGFKGKTLLTESTTLPHPVDIANISNLLVYCDIVEPSVVGHVKVPLLRVIAVNGKYGENKRDIFHHVFYHPIKQKYFDTIEIDIRDNTGRKIPFVRGNVIATLHFRLRKSPQFI
ncbi:hypothetical protein HOLleu_40127 [Holothuria leucospilota]|uniref:Integrase catalytic domain-containing protein n=1 Tax=Holothuria leucospilota TaxID=206669 RepID=A0A9Q0YHV5_HOLLE|nr:hypothetical protein HOLleu_40127 [Holothuria leucospilota]